MHFSQCIKCSQHSCWLFILYKCNNHFYYMNRTVGCWKLCISHDYTYKPNLWPCDTSPLLRKIIWHRYLTSNYRLYDQHWYRVNSPAGHVTRSNRYLTLCPGTLRLALCPIHTTFEFVRICGYRTSVSKALFILVINCRSVSVFSPTSNAHHHN